jgi:hypothetical protein
MKRRSEASTPRAALSVALILAAFAGAGFWFLSTASSASDPALPTLAAPLNTLPPTSESPAAQADLLPAAAPPPTATPAPNFLTTWFNTARDLLLAEDLSTNVPPTPLPQSVRAYLPFLLQNYEPPPRPPEAFVLLPHYPTDQWPTAAERPTQSKLGVMTLGTGDPYLMEFIRRTKPAVIKSVGDVGWLPEVKQASPTTVTIGRLGDDEASVQRELLEIADPTLAAQIYVERYLNQYQLNPGVDYWEGWNEFVPVNAPRLQWFADFEATRACLMQQYGFRAAVGGFSYGNPQYDEMELFIPALEAAYRCGGIFHLHEGVPPTLTCKTVTVGEANAIPGAPAFRVPVGHHAFRYRFWYEGYLRPRGMGDLSLVISELAVAPDCNIPGGDAWRNYEQWWINNGVGPSGPQAYVNLLAWYDREMQHDSYVIGTTIFAAGTLDSANVWYRLDLHEILIPLAHYEVSYFP